MRARSGRVLWTAVGIAVVGGVCAALASGRGGPRLLPIFHGTQAPISVSRDGRFLATASWRADAVVLYDLKHNSARTLTTHGVNEFYAYRMTNGDISFSPDGATLIHGGSSAWEPTSTASLNVWNTADGAHVRTFALEQLRGPSAPLSPDGALVAAGGRDNSVCLWDPSAGVLKARLRGHMAVVTALAFSRDGKLLASGGIEPDPSIRLWDIAAGKPLWTVARANGVRYVTSLACSPDGSTIACGSQDGPVLLLDARTGSLVRTLRYARRAGPSRWQLLVHRLLPFLGHVAVRIAAGNRETYVAYSPNGKLLAASGAAGVVLWDTRTGAMVRQVEGAVGPVAWLPDGSALAAPTDGPQSRVALWPVQ